ncbi:response regulator receiver modulated diguanylate cyclase [Geoalkalibacter ferrihydriticus]|uniref:diguanylate cyclase n=2 Tax=Geoalkalibacter ferrihydriticus TaxID=392333 RepID=A0A0C2HW13_9BACT|nr:diguanylate cyclase [Geoalkalibacter ferrihydriticus]KIH76947.1 hypothetical protein GFER_07630 [Geoalkalibacter ferrihydriticus DSM 17813]SDL43081.1 response regulator receiver modulated diguanylate cyclase [Geoalkalibacter ferrihydriticus]
MKIPTLLVADAESSCHRLFADSFGGNECEIVTADSWQAALHRLSSGGIDLVFVDPKISGFNDADILNAARHCRPPVDVILAVGQGERQAALKILQNGFSGFILEPFDTRELSHLVRQCLERRALVLESQRLSRHARLMSEGLSLLATLDLAPMLECAVALGVRESGAEGGFAFVRDGDGFVLHGLQGFAPGAAQAWARLLFPRLSCTENSLYLNQDEANVLQIERPLTAFALCARQVVEGGLILIGAASGTLDREGCDLLARQVAVGFENVSRLQGVQELMYTDDLTGLYNYRYLQVVLEQELRRAGRYRLEFSLIFVDLDYFKEINDCHGHLIGSAILREVGQVLRSCVRDTDFLFRYGGDEFTAMLVGTEGDGARVVAERIRLALEEHAFLAERGINAHLTATIGVSTFPLDSEDHMELLNLADRAMYWGKERRNVVRYARDMTAS